MNWRLLVVVACVAVVCAAIFGSKGDIDRFLKMRRM
jgi:NADH:ubiquinone oxidoreductase subunit B-like Fe-S oxidoreductase